ncbi:MAG: DUF364 domain-containing protein [Thermodesulfobacteriota bacterium]
MSIAEKLKDLVMPVARGVRVRDVRIGLIYTAVMLEDGRTGLAFTFHQGRRGDYSRLKALHPLPGRDASDLVVLLNAPEQVERAVGLATVNALFNSPHAGAREGDFLDMLDIRPGERVGMVGLFTPVLPRLREATSSILVFEQNLDRGREADLLPEEDAYRLLPGCGVALITSTSLVNHTMDRLLAAAQNCREVVLLGASTPLVPEAFAGTCVTLLSGVVVLDPERILCTVSEAGGTRSFKEDVRKVNVPLRK